MNILFVCTGNTCRSPMAELYFNAVMARTGGSHRARSAGLSACPGDTISHWAGEVMRVNGIDPGAFRSRRISRYMLEESDMIVAMTRSHAEALASAAPEFAPKIRELARWRPAGGISDPFGGGSAVYTLTFAAIREAVDNLITEITASGEEK
ncbi:MAG: low molecular weight protein arginine phosphatase [Lentisphaeria bacterium]|nr:low molecular weight protein arginine phosphatase [Lentisphaeria bacterium]